MRISSKHQRRAGNVLVLFALLLFVIFAVAALTIDLGLARLSRRQMQGATDAAAIEGLRYRDNVPPWVTDPNSAILQQIRQDIGVDPANPANRDQVRRWMARNQINLTFTDGVDPVTGNPVQYGAGPNIQTSGGVGEANAFQTLHMPQPGDVTVYKPTVQLNLGNAQAGDLVAGNFISAMAASEDANYLRLDFLPLGAGGDSFLTRLRRTKDTVGNDRNPNDDQPGISTSGNALPLLFGQGSLVAGADPTTGYSPRHHGITVRGTSIAQARPALAVGAAVPTDPTTNIPGMAGAATFAIKLADWQTLPTFGATNAIFYQPVSATRTMVIVGDTLVATAGGALPPATSNQVYVPLVNDAGLVAGFGLIQYNADGTLTKLAPRVASENATASTAVLQPNAADPSIPDPNNAAVLALLTALMSNANLASNQQLFLLSPALVR